MGKRKRIVENETEMTNETQEKHVKRLIPATVLSKLKLTEKQIELMNIIDKNKIILITGPAGTSKTTIMIYYVLKALQKQTFDKIILTKPIEESGERLGYLPGDIASKIDPFIESYKYNFLKYITKQNYDKLIKDEIIEFKPLAYMRGLSFENHLMLLDEAQNADWKRLMLFVTRMGINSKVIIAGDTSQYDIKKDMVALNRFSDMVKDIEDVAVFEFTENDIMRDPILKEITKRYEKLKYSGEIKEERGK